MSITMRIARLIVFIITIISFNSCSLYENKIREEEQEKYYHEYKKLPKPIGPTNDYEGLLTEEQKQELDSIINNFEKHTKNQIVIVTVSEIEPYESLQDFTTDLGNYWRVGQKRKNNGLIITVSKNMRNIWIGTGYGTEKILTDEIIKSIIDNEIIPYFRNDEYYSGIKLGLIECINRWK